MTEQSSNAKEGELTCLYWDILEKTIKEDPANYLWSYRRFKFEWKDEYRPLGVDTTEVSSEKNNA